MAERPRYRVQSATGGWTKNFPFSAPPGNGTVIIVDSNNAGEYQQWDIIRGMPGLYVFGNFATRFYIARRGANELICGPNVQIAQWSLESAGGGFSIIRVPNEDLLWTVIDGNHLELRPADGSEQQRFQFIPETQ